MGFKSGWRKFPNKKSKDSAGKERTAGKWDVVDNPISQLLKLFAPSPLDIQSNGVEYSPPVR